MTREQELVAGLEQLLKQHAEGQPIQLAEQITMLLERQEVRVAGERKWRRQLLDIHGARGLVAGALIIIGGAPDLLEDQFGVASRSAFGYLPLLAGVLLIVGGRLYPPYGATRRIGLIMLGFWDLLFGLALVAAILSYSGDWAFSWPWELVALPADQPRLYAPAVYLALCLMLWSPHLRALLTERRMGQAAERAARNAA